MNKLFAREAAGFAIAASVGLGLGVAYKDYATKKYGGDAKALLAEAKALRAAQQPAAAALKMRECLDLVEAKGGAHQRRTEHTAQLARALAATLEEAAEDATRPRRAAYLAEAEAAWTTALEAAPPRHALRAVALDRLASYAQSRGDHAAAKPLYARAVRALATPEEINAGADSLKGHALDLAAIMANFAGCIYEDAGDGAAALKVLDQSTKVCRVVADPEARWDCEARVRELRAHIAAQGPGRR